MAAAEVAFVPDPERWLVEGEGGGGERERWKKWRWEGGLVRVTCFKSLALLLMEY